MRPFAIPLNAGRARRKRYTQCKGIVGKIRMDQKFEKWVKWIDVISEQVRNVLIQKDIFWQVQAIIKDHGNLKASSFFAFLGDSYATLGSTAVRRLVKNQKDSISLTGLLNDMIENSEILTKKRDIIICQKSDALDLLLAEELEEMLNNIGEHIAPAILRNEYSQLIKMADPIESYVDQGIAHIDKKLLNGTSTVPTFNQMDECIDFIEKLTIKYLWLLKSESQSSLLPTYQ
jgi:hypothetical protein